MEAKLKHLELVQGVINRMAGNSFLLKGWSVTLVAAIFVLASKDSNPIFWFLGYFPCISFWSLDGYFLWQERMYRKLYESVANKDPESIDFNMNAYKFKPEVHSWAYTCLSSTLLMFHGIVFGAVVLVMFASF